jgi:uncharacterized protein (DUF1501 family)
MWLIISRYPCKGHIIVALVKAKHYHIRLQTSVYITTQFNYDHHNAQVDTADATQGKHAGLLNRLSEAIDAFMDDLQLMGMQDRVLCLVYSEFGRRIKSNASYGTDHGPA